VVESGAADRSNGTEQQVFVVQSARFVCTPLSYKLGNCPTTAPAYTGPALTSPRAHHAFHQRFEENLLFYSHCFMGELLKHDFGSHLARQQVLDLAKQVHKVLPNEDRTSYGAHWMKLKSGELTS